VWFAPCMTIEATKKLKVFRTVFLTWCYYQVNHSATTLTVHVFVFSIFL